MAYSASDFQGDIINHLIELEMLEVQQVETDLAQATAEIKATISSEHRIAEQARSVVRFHDELLASVETLTGLAQVHGVETLANVVYLQTAILRNNYIEVPGDDPIVKDIIPSLPSAEKWLAHVSTPLDFTFCKTYLKYVCPYCGSDDVTKDGVAHWNVPNQRWELGSTYDDASCNVCQRDIKTLGETTVSPPFAA